MASLFLASHPVLIHGSVPSGYCARRVVHGKWLRTSATLSLSWSACPCAGRHSGTGPTRRLSGVRSFALTACRSRTRFPRSGPAPLSERLAELTKAPKPVWDVDPVLVQLGPLSIRYYSLSFVLASTPCRSGLVTGTFLITYFSLRFCVELFKEFFEEQLRGMPPSARSRQCSACTFTRVSG